MKFISVGELGLTAMSSAFWWSVLYFLFSGRPAGFPTARI